MYLYSRWTAAAAAAAAAEAAVTAAAVGGDSDDDASGFPGTGRPCSSGDAAGIGV